MGLLADLHQDPLMLPGGVQWSAQTRHWTFSHVGFGITARLWFDTSVPGLPPPGGREVWRFGFVQNVMYERLRLVYDDGAVFDHAWPHATLDALSPAWLPFVEGPDGPRERGPLATVSGAGCEDLYYCPTGLGVELDRRDPYGMVVVPGNSASFSFFRQPSTAVRARRGGALREFRHVRSVRCWLMARPPEGRMTVLLAAEPISLQFWADLAAPNGRKLKPHSWSDAGAACGIVRDLPKRFGPLLHARPLYYTRKGPPPLMNGALAAGRVEQWLRSNDLLPHAAAA